jgi:GNAT superfamily N-acetyltransferase
MHARAFTLRGPIVIQVRQVAGRPSLAAFINFPYVKYRGHPYWVPPLRMSERERFDPRRSPFLEHADMGLFLAVVDGNLEGRIAAIDDRNHQATHHDNVAMFGFFEANSDAVARDLLKAAEQWALTRGRTALRGPLNPSLNESAGLLVDGFDDAPMLLMPYNPPEYADYITGAGYAKIKDLYAWIYDLNKPADPRVVDLADRVKTRHQVVIRQIDTKRMEEEIRNFMDIYAQAWTHNWGFVAPTAKEAAQFANELKQILDPTFVLSAEVQGRRAGCIVAVPDLNQVLKGTNGRLFPTGLLRFLRRGRLIDQGRLLLLGVLPEYRRLGLLPLMVIEMARRAANKQYRRVEFSWVLEDNVDINQPAEQAGARRYKTYRIYQKALS